jgi:hypothetical protein
MAGPPHESEIKDLIAAAIYRHAPGTVEELAQAIITGLQEAGFEITRARPDRPG